MYKWCVSKRFLSFCLSFFVPLCLYITVFLLVFFCFLLNKYTKGNINDEGNWRIVLFFFIFFFLFCLNTYIINDKWLFLLVMWDKGLFFLQCKKIKISVLGKRRIRKIDEIGNFQYYFQCKIIYLFEKWAQLNHENI